jgi:hypothetical protein
VTELLENAKLTLYPKIKAWKDAKERQAKQIQVPETTLNKASEGIKNLIEGGEALKRTLESFEKLPSTPIINHDMNLDSYHEPPAQDANETDDLDGFKSFVPKDEVEDELAAGNIIDEKANWSDKIPEPPISDLPVEPGTSAPAGTENAPLYVSEHPKVYNKRKKGKHHAKK